MSERSEPTGTRTRFPSRCPGPAVPGTHTPPEPGTTPQSEVPA